MPAWRARRVADATMSLTPGGGGVRGPAGRRRRREDLAAAVGPADHRGQGPARGRGAAGPVRSVPSRPRRSSGGRAHRPDVTFDGTVPVVGELDLADALHLDQALTAGAEQLRLAGSADTLDARRAVALGEMSRAQLALTLDQTEDATSTGKPVRPVTLYLHLSEAALTGGSPVGRCENTQTPVNAETIRAWCGHPDTVITVRPILDLTEHVRVDQYEIPDRLRAQIDHRDGGCVFPWCTRPARACDRRSPRALRRVGPGPRSDLLLQPRTAVPTSPPVEDPHPVALPITRTRRLPLEQPARLHLPPQPHPARSTSPRPMRRPPPAARPVTHPTGSHAAPHPATCDPWRGHRRTRGSAPSSH